jgi:pilus assembly protein Flp/PilA
VQVSERGFIKGGIMQHLMALLIYWQGRVRDREAGQGMVEYGLIIAAVAIAVIVALFALGPKIGSMFSSTAASLQ